VIWNQKLEMRAAIHDVNYTDIIVEALTRFPDREAFVFGDRRVTYAQTARRTSCFLQALASRLSAGGGIAVLSSNMPEVWMVQTAAYLLGARYTGLHPLGSIDDYVHVCEHAAIEMLIVHPDELPRAMAVAARSPTVRQILTLGYSTDAEDVIALSERFSSRPLRRRDVSAEDVHWVAYTGGTTGRSKGVEEPDRALVYAVQTIATSLGLPETPRFLAVAPISHAGVLPIAPTLARGGTVIIHNGFDPDHWLRTIEQERINWTFAVPTMLYKLLDSGFMGRFDLSSLETIMYGSSPMAPTRIAEAHAAFGPVLLQAYGQGECLSFATTLRKDEHQPESDPDLLLSCGRAIVGTRVEVLGEDNNSVPTGDVGEICVRSPGVMRGYRSDPEQTAAAFSGDWLHTGDMAQKDERGFLYIVDRKKDMIITGGFNVYSKEVEDVIAQMSSVAVVAVIGVPDEHWGEAVKAIIVPRPGTQVDPETVIDVVRRKKGAHQAPKSVDIVTSLPQTSVGKIDKKKLRAAFWSGKTRGVN
jgi:fatty-acyl-CoA synthase